MSEEREMREVPEGEEQAEMVKFRFFNPQVNARHSVEYEAPVDSTVVDFVASLGPEHDLTGMMIVINGNAGLPENYVIREDDRICLHPISSKVVSA